MNNKTLTSLIVRLAGFTLFVKIFDFFGAYFLSIYLTASWSLMDKTYGMSDAFDKFFISGTILAFANLVLALVLILKADWIANKITKTEVDLTIDLTGKSIMRIIISTIGIIYCDRTLYNIPTATTDIITIINWHSEDSNSHLIGNIIGDFVRFIIGLLFILKSKQITNYALKGMKSL
ncbi:hypothetical protein [Crocinitomix catalasitica]|uniref:hypothetical protein n=1 Tax=Crocinitomix catalasitica TaxID=184607 RepID=UPI000485AD57|nr:hypothetical protein [Crocinitomix catalasitica]